MNDEMLENIERILKIKFYDWQRKYLLNEPQLLDLKITGRSTGKTLCHILKLLLSDIDDPLIIENFESLISISDWWCVTDEAGRYNGRANHYAYWFRGELLKIKELLNSNGINTKKVLFDGNKRRA